MLTQLLVVLILAQSATPPPAREVVTVSAEAGREASLESVPQRVNILSREKLMERLGNTLTDAMREEPGLEMQRTGTFLGGVFIRGLTGNKVVVYRDGVRYSTSAARGGVSTFFNLLESEAIEQVEVLRGPNSAQYGSDSIGGVISVITRTADKQSPRLEWTPFFASANNSFGNSLSLVRSADCGGIVVRGFGQRVNPLRTGGGIDTRSALTRFLGLPSSLVYERQPDSGFTQYGGSLHGQLRLSPQSDLVLHYDRDQQDGAKRTDQLLGGDGARRAAVANIMGDFAYLRYNRSAWAGIDLLSLAGSYLAQREERINQSTPTAAVQRQYERVRTWGAQAQAAKRWKGNDLFTGAEFYQDGVRSPAQNTLPRIPTGASFQHYGLYLQDGVQLWQQRLRISGALRWGGGRYDGPNAPRANTANAWTGRIGAVLRPSSGLSVHSYVSRGFRAPSITDLGTLGLQGNGNFEVNVYDIPGGGPLAPELSANVDLGFKLRGKGLVFELTGFRSEISQLVVSQTLLLPAGAVGQRVAGELITSQRPDGAVFVALSNNVVQVKRNQDQARFLGLEQRLEWKPRAGWTLEQGLTWLRADDPSNGRVPNVEGAYPPAMGYLKARWNPAGKRFWVEPYWTLNDAQRRLSDLALADRRIGASRTRGQIATFYNDNPAYAALTGLPLAQLQNQLLGTTASAPLFPALPGYGVFGLRGGISVSERLSLYLDAGNLADKSYRGMSWGVDGAGRGVSLQLRWKL
jgi:hemoglobin/transferrin/lactoferrin receptor protein